MSEPIIVAGITSRFDQFPIDHKGWYIHNGEWDEDARFIGLSGEWQTTAHYWPTEAAAREFASSLAARSQPAEGANGWLPIDSAPKDGTPFLVLTAHGDMYAARCGFSDHFVSLPGFWAIKKARFWRPLPSPPTEQKDAAQ